MGTLLFTLFWVVLGVGLVVLALRGGRGGRARSSGRAVRSRGMPRSWILGFVAVLVVFGVVVPVLVTADFLQSDEASVAEGASITLTEQETHGRELFAQRCSNCHTLEAANASASVGPNLDELQPPYELVLNAIEEGRSRGNGQMPADLVEGADAEAVAAFVAKATGGAPPGGQD